jgi:hypothetical protein
MAKKHWQKTNSNDRQMANRQIQMIDKWPTDIWPIDKWPTDIWPIDKWPTDIWFTDK